MAIATGLEDDAELEAYMDEVSELIMKDVQQDLPDAPTFKHEIDKEPSIVEEKRVAVLEE